MSISNVEKSIEVEVPVHVAYNQWTQFEEFPLFMKNVQEVKQLGDKNLLWRVKIGGKEEQWNAEITEQIPDSRIAWKATEGKENSGVVTFHRLAEDKSKVMLQMSYETEGFTENAADAMGLISGSVEKDLESFKEFIESRGRETGAWRGEVKQENK
jgi:uncharacterized membrane protein